MSKTVNVKFRYGHQIIVGQPGISIYPAGLSITPSYYTELWIMELLLNINKGVLLLIFQLY